MRDKPILHLAVVMLVGLLALQGCRGTGQDATAPSPVAPSASPVATAPSPVATAPSPSTKAPSALPKDPGSSAQVLQDAIRRVRARDTLAEDASKNGYPDLKDCLQRETPAQVKAPYLALAPWTFPASGKNDTDILVAYGKHRTEIQAAVKTFETVLPVLDRVLAKPNFLWPSEWDKGPAASVPNFVQLRAIVQNMVGYAEYCAVTGKPGQALQYLVGTIELGARVAQNGVLLSCMIGIALDSIGLEGAFQVLGRSPGLTAKDYRKALARLSSLPLTPRTMLDRMDEEHAFQMNTVDLLIRDPKLRESFPLGGNPEALERERNLLPTLYMMQRPSIARLHDPKEDGVNMDRAIHDSHSTVAAVMFPNTEKAMAHYRMVLTKIGGLKLLCALQLHKLEKGAYPDRLEQLVPSFLEALPRDYVSQDGHFTYQGKGQDFQLSTTPKPALATVLRLKTFRYHPPEPRQ